MTEHEHLVASLEAERLRPDTKPPSLEDALRELIGALHRLYQTPPDDDEKAKNSTS